MAYGNQMYIFLFSYVRGARKITLKPLNFDNFQKRPPHDNSKSELKIPVFPLFGWKSQDDAPRL